VLVVVQVTAVAVDDILVQFADMGCTTLVTLVAEALQNACFADDGSLGIVSQFQIEQEAVDDR